VFSSGVHLATYAGLLVARSINTCLRGELAEHDCFREFERRYRREFGHFHDFLIAFYDIDQDVNSYFWAARRVAKSAASGNEAFLKLVSGMGAAEPVVVPVRELAAAREGLGRVLFPASDGEGIQVAVEDNFPNLERHRFMESFLTEVVQVQTQAALREQRAHERPLFENGLVPSADGLHWVRAPLRRRRHAFVTPS
jgi:halogenation protein CepH